MFLTFPNGYDLQKFPEVVLVVSQLPSVDSPVPAEPASWSALPCSLGLCPRGSSTTSHRAPETDGPWPASLCDCKSLQQHGRQNKDTLISKPKASGQRHPADQVPGKFPPMATSGIQGLHQPKVARPGSQLCREKQARWPAPCCWGEAQPRGSDSSCLKTGHPGLAWHPLHGFPLEQLASARSPLGPLPVPLHHQPQSSGRASGLWSHLPRSTLVPVQIWEVLRWGPPTRLGLALLPQSLGPCWSCLGLSN